MNSKNIGYRTQTTCPKIGIKIHETLNNNYKNEPFEIQSVPIPKANANANANANKQNTNSLDLDLDLDHYSLEDLYKLFNIYNGLLNETALKEAKQMTLKMHPDKSRLDSKYFLFFSKAYKRLYGIYEFQNKSIKKTYKDEDFFDESNRNVLNNMFEKNKKFKDSINFNSWFNEAFEKHRIENPNDQGYGEWLKTDEGMINIEENVTKGNMNEIFEQKKKQIQGMTVYTGVTDMISSSFGGSMLNGGDNFSSDGFTDLRQAYTETLIPVTQEDYSKIQKFNNISEYKAHRDRVDIAPLSKEESQRQLLRQKNKLDHDSAALAYKYAQESEKIKESQKSFWGDINRLTF